VLGIENFGNGCGHETSKSQSYPILPAGFPDRTYQGMMEENQEAEQLITRWIESYDHTDHP
jgi:hypothetical protein